MKIRTTGAGISIALGTLLALTLCLSRAASAEIVYPVERARISWTRQVWTRIRGFFTSASTAAENRALREEVSRLRTLQVELDSLERENARLRRLLQYDARAPQTMISAPVLSRGGGVAAAHQTLRAGKGSLDGIERGAIVLVPAGVVGRVTAVSPHTSEVTLITDSQIKVGCEIQGIAARGVLVGGSESSLALRYLSCDEDRIPSSARVITSGIGGVFPRGLFVGTYQGEGSVRPAVDFENLEDVFIRREK